LEQNNPKADNYGNRNELNPMKHWHALTGPRIWFAARGQDEQADCRTWQDVKQKDSEREPEPAAGLHGHKSISGADGA
jgi:hypothetical protein